MCKLPIFQSSFSGKENFLIFEQIENLRFSSQGEKISEGQYQFGITTSVLDRYENEEWEKRAQEAIRWRVDKTLIDNMKRAEYQLRTECIGARNTENKDRDTLKNTTSDSR